MEWQDFIWRKIEDGSAVIDGFYKDIGYSPCIEIPEKTGDGRVVTGISDYAFECCDKLKHVIFPPALEWIGECAFWGCSSLTEVEFPDSLKFLGKGAFYACPLSEIYLPPHLRNSIMELFTGDKYVPLAYRDDTECFEIFTRIGLRKISLSESDSRFSIDDGVLFDKTRETLLCYPPEKITTHYIVPNGTTIIGRDSFFGCKNLKQVIFPNSLKRIEDYAFSNAGIQKLWIPDSVENISRKAFWQCIELSEIHLPEKMQVYFGYEETNNGETNILR